MQCVFLGCANGACSVCVVAFISWCTFSSILPILYSSWAPAIIVNVIVFRLCGSRWCGSKGIWFLVPLPLVAIPV